MALLSYTHIDENELPLLPLPYSIQWHQLKYWQPESTDSIGGIDSTASAGGTEETNVTDGTDGTKGADEHWQWWEWWEWQRLQQHAGI